MHSCVGDGVLAPEHDNDCGVSCVHDCDGLQRLSVASVTEKPIADSGRVH